MRFHPVFCAVAAVCVLVSFVVVAACTDTVF